MNVDVKKVVLGIMRILILYIFISLLRLYFDKDIYPIIEKNEMERHTKEAFKSKHLFVVTDKYLDSTNHNNETIVGSDFKGKKEVIYGSPGYWTLYKIVSIGDTVIKEKNSYNFIIKNLYVKRYNIYKYVHSVR